MRKKKRTMEQVVVELEERSLRMQMHTKTILFVPLDDVKEVLKDIVEGNIVWVQK